MDSARVAVLSSVHEALDPRIFHKQARTLAAAGFEVHLLARHTHDQMRQGVRIHALPEPRSRWARPAQWVRLAWHTWRLRPRVIHVHDPELLPLLLVLGRLTGATTVYDAHEYYGEEIARRAWIPRPLRRPAARLTELVETFVAGRLDAVVAVNEHMAARFRRRGARAVAVHNFPPAEYFDDSPSPQPSSLELGDPDGPAPPCSRDSVAVGAPSPTPSGRGSAPVPRRGEGADHGISPTTQSSVLSPQSSVVGYVGLLSPDRGLATVYEAARLLRQRLPKAGVRVIGRVDWSGLPASVPRDPVAWAAAGVELTGTIPADAVPAALAEIAVGWIPFQDTGNNRRTIPLKLLEYMAAGKPVVASAIGFIATIVRESGCGVLVPWDDPAAHAEALAALLADPKEQQRLGAAGRAAVRARYSWASEGETLVRLYREITVMHQQQGDR